MATPLHPPVHMLRAGAVTLELSPSDLTTLRAVLDVHEACERVVNEQASSSATSLSVVRFPRRVPPLRTIHEALLHACEHSTHVRLRLDHRQGIEVEGVVEGVMPEWIVFRHDDGLETIDEKRVISVVASERSQAPVPVPVPDTDLLLAKIRRSLAYLLDSLHYIAPEILRDRVQDVLAPIVAAIPGGEAVADPAPIEGPTPF